MSGRIRRLPRGPAEWVRVLRSRPAAFLAVFPVPPRAPAARHRHHQTPTTLPHRMPSTQPGAHRTAPPPYHRNPVSENSLVIASPGPFREWHHISKGKSHPCGRYSASTAKYAACSKGSLARGAGARAVLQAKRSFQRDTTLCKCYNACKAWYRCTSGGISVKAAPAAPPLRDAPRCGGRTAPARRCHISRRTLLINTMRHVSRIKALARFTGHFTHDTGVPSRCTIRAHHAMRD